MIDNNITHGNKTESYNQSLLIQKDINEEYPLINDQFRNKIANRMGRNSKMGPVFSGGDIKEKFLLPTIQSASLQQKKKLFSEAFNFTTPRQP